ncbi:efflux RND transporter periplasmic adaptor subunit [Brevundimonas naejangsanensis]|uniref:Efflux transporter periplasmic adaptor subunit n=1 Tax=Brevundimonas naejangsanensis TaxID=588932 RepID=A0A172Y4X1_9CAUL|nr:efflux RND transporter periplasmic adaptor subunit [Brevundimonas naejangsanensis]ANF54253.1 efflux transporter periplasmic adaptor subunit [Brevundimonas naejangsanensis]QBQ48010.1 efflux RND transporter periplasmic adaptor subunit [Brevundimonas naejangsanensis]
MRPNRKQLIVLAVAVLVGLAVTAAILLRRPPEAAVATVKPQTVELGLSVVGRARPMDLVQVASPNPGQVVRLMHDDGDRVAAGEPLAVILASVEQAQTEADLARERAARAEAADARLKYERTRTLSERGFAAPAALDAARTSLQAAEANVAAAAAAVRASAERAREFTIRAPMSGVVLVRPIDNGQVVAAGETLFELGSAAGVEIRAEVEEAYADAIRPGMAARASLSGTSTIFAARVTEVSPQVDAATGGRLVKLAPEAGPSLSPGRSIDVTIVVGQRSGAIVLPRNAVADATAAPKVYVVDADDIVRERAVVVARWPTVNALIERGLAAGDRVVLDPASARAGARVRPVAPKTED